MESWSPSVRRTVAVGLLVALLWAVVTYLLLPVLDFTSRKIDELEQARFEEARLAAKLRQPPLPKADDVPRNLAFAAVDRPAAVSRVEAHLAEIAGRHLVEIVSSGPGAPGAGNLVAVRIAAVGDEPSLRAFVEELETGQPLIRFTGWHWQSGESATGIQFEGTATAIWRP